MNVLGQLESQNSNLVPRLTENAELCGLFLALVGKCIVISNERGRPIEGITISRPNMDSGILRAKVNFASLHVASIHVALGGQSDFFDHLQAKSQGMALAMKRNPHFVTFLHALIDIVGSWSQHKGKKFKDVKVVKAFIDKDDFINVDFREDMPRWMH